ncbi:hypothetical protein KAU19_06550 [Candidatus Parcubacteria bacterium]|nr:hypothetical protein [Candidatus Parcubacteria bacterium]
MENNNQKPLTLSDLGKFTEDVLLPAIEDMMDQKLEEKLETKLAPIKSELLSIKQDIEWIKDRIKRIENASSEDVIAVNNEVENLKIRVVELENQVKILQTSGSRA